MTRTCSKDLQIANGPDKCSGRNSQKRRKRKGPMNYVDEKESKLNGRGTIVRTERHGDWASEEANRFNIQISMSTRTFIHAWIREGKGLGNVSGMSVPQSILYKCRLCYYVYNISSRFQIYLISTSSYKQNKRKI